VSLPRVCFVVCCLLALSLCSGAYAAPAGDNNIEAFRPLTPVMPVEDIRPGMKGRALTVVKGRDIVSFPVTVVSVLPTDESPGNLILIKVSGPLIEKTGGIAAGMSGSPVYIGGKLAGAIGYGWNFSEHDLGLVTPIEEMALALDWPDRLPVLPREPMNLEPLDSRDVTGFEDVAEMAAPMVISGCSERAAESIEQTMGRDIMSLPGNVSGKELPVEYDAVLEPGEAVSVLLAWGDVSLAATGTLTATGEDGRFLAFAHPFIDRGAVAYPLARSWVHDVVPSMRSPFKLGTPVSIVGIVTQDRPQAIGGITGTFAPVVDLSLVLKDVDSGKEEHRRFHVVYDPFLITEILPELLTGLVDMTWARKGQGTARVSLFVEGGSFVEGWERTNMFFSDEDIAKTIVGDCADLVRVISLNPFKEINPLGIHVELEITSEPRVLLIEDIKVPEEDLAVGESFDVTVTLHPYREKPQQKTFELTVPEGASGMCEVVVRGGGIEEPGQDTLAQGWRTIQSLDELLTEISSMETNDEVIVEIRSDAFLEQDIPPMPGDENEQKLQSEIRKDKMEKGHLRSFRSNYYVDGLLRRMLSVEGQ